MKFIIAFIGVLACWIFSFVNSSGWGEAYGTPELMYKILVAVSLILLLSESKKWNYNYRVYGNLLIFLLLFFFVLMPLYLNSSTDGLKYLSSFLTIYCFSYTKPTIRLFHQSGLFVAMLGIAVLMLYKTILSGWNDNGIAMIGLFSFLFYAISLFGKVKLKFLIWGLIISFIYASFLFSMDSRSSIVFIVIAFVAIFLFRIIEPFLKMRFTYLFLLLVPLFLAIITCQVASTDYFPKLDLWSYNKYGKPFFNGRDELWQQSFDYLWDSYGFGMYKFRINFHNSAMACLAVFGVGGYITWIASFWYILKNLNNYLNEPYVYGGVVAFLLIYLQQSLDLGFINECPNMVPYMMLGLCIARAKMAHQLLVNEKH